MQASKAALLASKRLALQKHAADWNSSLTCVTLAVRVLPLLSPLSPFLSLSLLGKVGPLR